MNTSAPIHHGYFCFKCRTIVFSAEPLLSAQNHSFDQRGIVLNHHVTQLMVWEVPSSLNILFDVAVWKIPVYHPALVVKFYRVNLESLITLLIDIQTINLPNLVQLCLSWFGKSLI